VVVAELITLTVLQVEMVEVVVVQEVNIQHTTVELAFPDREMLVAIPTILVPVVHTAAVVVVVDLVVVATERTLLVVLAV
jgi:hypothetical protein